MPPSSSQPPVQHLNFHHSAGAALPVELLHLHELRQRDGRLSLPTRLNFHLLMFVTAGHGKHWIDFESHPLRKGDLISIRPSQIHSFEKHSNHDAILFLFLPEAAPDPTALDNLNLRRHPLARPKPGDWNLLENLLAHFECLSSKACDISPSRQATYTTGAIVAAVADILATQIDSDSSSLPHFRELVLRFEQLFVGQKRFSRQLSWYLDQLPASGRTLARACHAVRGQSPKKLIDNHLSLEAKRLLLLSEDSVEQISWQLGFTEATNFIKFFKRIAGITPVAFRNQDCHF